MSERKKILIYFFKKKFKKKLTITDETKEIWKSKDFTRELFLQKKKRMLKNIFKENHLPSLNTKIYLLILFSKFRNSSPKELFLKKRK